jgi:large subunit ribosomal protein L6
MSRIAKAPVVIPSGVDVRLDGQELAVKGAKGEMTFGVHRDVEVVQGSDELTFAPRSKGSMAMAGTMRALVQNMVTGVSTGFERRLELQGVGYRAQVQGSTITLQLGFSHPVEYELPQGVEAQAPSQTELVLTGTDKQQLGQVCAEIRAFRPPEPYKGKGVRYQGEYVRRKEAKKK